jgi:hypothetical protein
MGDVIALNIPSHATAASSTACSTARPCTARPQANAQPFRTKGCEQEEEEEGRRNGETSSGGRGGGGGGTLLPVVQSPPKAEKAGDPTDRRQPSFLRRLPRSVLGISRFNC